MNEPKVESAVWYHFLQRGQLCSRPAVVTQVHCRVTCPGRAVGESDLLVSFDPGDDLSACLATPDGIATSIGWSEVAKPERWTWAEGPAPGG